MDGIESNELKQGLPNPSELLNAQWQRLDDLFVPGSVGNAILPEELKGRERGERILDLTMKKSLRHIGEGRDLVSINRRLSTAGINNIGDFLHANQEAVSDVLSSPKKSIEASLQNGLKLLTERTQIALLGRLITIPHVVLANYLQNGTYLDDIVIPPELERHFRTTMNDIILGVDDPNPLTDRERIAIIISWGLDDGTHGSIRRMGDICGIPRRAPQFSALVTRRLGRKYSSMQRVYRLLTPSINQ